MWQKKGRAPEEAPGPRPYCSPLLGKRRTPFLSYPKTKTKEHKNSLEWRYFIFRLGTDTRCSGQCQESQSHLLFSPVTSHSISPLHWNRVECSGEAFPFSNNRNRPWIQKGNYNLTVSSSENIPCLFALRLLLYNLTAVAYWRWQDFLKTAGSLPWIPSFITKRLFCKLVPCVGKGRKTTK